MPRWLNKHRQLRSRPGLCRQSAAAGRRRATCRGAELYGLAVETAERPGPPAVGDGMDGKCGADHTGERLPDNGDIILQWSATPAKPAAMSPSWRRRARPSSSARMLRPAASSASRPNCGEGSEAWRPKREACAADTGAGNRLRTRNASISAPLRRSAGHSKVPERPFFFIRQLAPKPHTSTLFNSKFQNTRVY